MITTLIFLGTLFGGMAIGLSIAVALVLSGIAMMWQLDFFNTQLLAQNLMAGFDSFPLLAVPFFILAGELMNAGGLSQRIIDMARSFVGHIPGGLGYVTIFAAILLASMSGSAIADTAALSTILLPMMRQQNYPDTYSTGLLASGGIIAPVIPPSLPFIIYGVTTNTSISKLFISGVFPGLMMGAALLLAWRWMAHGSNLPAMPRANARERARSITDGVWAILMPVIILGGIRFGIFTPTEAAVVAAVYALFVATVVYRQMRWRDCYRILVSSSKTTAIVMFLCGAATVAAYMITLADLPSQLADLFWPGAGPSTAVHDADGAVPDPGGHRHGPDPHHPDLRAGLPAAGRQGRCRSDLLRLHFRADRLPGPDHAARRHGPERRRRRRQSTHGNRGQGRQSLPRRLSGVARSFRHFP